MVDPISRVNWGELERLIRNKLFFALHAPRQSGKTTLLRAIVERLNREDDYQAMVVTVEVARGFGNDAAGGIRSVVQQLINVARISAPDSWLATEGPIVAKDELPSGMLTFLLMRWAQQSPKPLVLLFDEIDTLDGDTLVSVLTQLRDGYISRETRPFLHSVIFCGVRDLREYRIRQSNGDVVTGSGCFNVKSESITLGNFSENEIRDLYVQHTQETGQVFDDAVIRGVKDLTDGQPWLVNALARELTRKMEPLWDRSRTIGTDDLDEAKERLILRRDTHIDHLSDRLRDPRVRKVVKPILSGEVLDSSSSQSDRQYVMDLGIIVRDAAGIYRIANKIYQEVIPREIIDIANSELVFDALPSDLAVQEKPLDFNDLMERFQQFYRENSEACGSIAEYGEAMPHLLLFAWLQRIVNGGGQIAREYALWRRRADVFVRRFYHQDGQRVEQRFLVEVKIIRDKRSRIATTNEGLTQIVEYADKCNPDEAHLLVVDPSSGAKRRWNKKISRRVHKVGNRSIVVWAM
jgi:hypothetical protein